MEQREFGNYGITCIAKALLADLKQDITTVKVDLDPSTLKPVHTKIVWKIFNYLKSDGGKQAKQVKKSKFSNLYSLN